MTADFGPAREIRCALCDSTAVLTQAERVTGSFGGSGVVTTAQNWWYECPRGHTESLEDAERRLSPS